MDFDVPANNSVRKKSEKTNELLNLARELKDTVELEGDSDTNCS